MQGDGFAVRHRCDGCHGGVDRGAVSTLAAGKMAFAGTAHRRGENIDSGGVKFAVAPRERRHADIGVDREIGQPAWLHGGKARVRRPLQRQMIASVGFYGDRVPIVAFNRRANADGHAWRGRRARLGEGRHHRQNQSGGNGSIGALHVLLLSG